MTPRRRRGPGGTDPARTTAYRLLRTVDEADAYANLVLPKLLTDAGVTGRDAAFATELGYGTLRTAGTLDAILARCADRSEIDPPVRDLLRLGAYQLLRTRVPVHAAVATTVGLSRDVGAGRASGFVNAVLRRVAARSWDEWVTDLSTGLPALDALALRTAHPAWIADAFARALDGDLTETERALSADNARPITHLVAWPGRSARDDLVAAVPGAEPGPYSPYAVRLAGGGEPGAVAAIRERQAGVQDEGSQLCALALSDAPLDGADQRWLDLCAGPGGKAALLAGLAAQRGARLVANELREHRARLVRQATAGWDVEVRTGDARTFPADDVGYDRVLLDAPCTGLGALRRRPEARWRRSGGDVAELAALQRELLASALRLARPGGVVAYVTCSPHPAETVEIVGDVAAGRQLLDARSALPAMPDLGDGPTVQLWPHRHGTDAMFLALVRA